MWSIDSILVALYFLVFFGLSMYLSLKNRKSSSDEDFMTGGRTMNWKQTGMTLIAMMFDPGVMGISALAFTWGFYVIQWNAVNVWMTAWFAGMFIIGIYWRSKIVTTPEYLEKRFNVWTRAVFSVIMIAMLISLLAYAVYMGGILLNRFLDWPIWLNIVLLAVVASVYVIVGGVKTMLMMDVIQGVLLLVTLIVVGVTGFVLLGGMPGIKELNLLGDAGTSLKSLVPPVEFDFKTGTYMPIWAIPTYCVIAGLSWIICNFSMAQRLLAAKDESHAQKSLIMAGVFNVFVLFLAYSAGIAARKLIITGHLPEVTPDEAFITLLLNYFPAGVKGILIIGLIAALLSTIDGLISSSGSLIAQDLYKRLIHPKASDVRMKTVTVILEVAVVVSVFLIVPIFMTDSNEAGGTPAYEIIQKFLGNVFGVLIAIYLLGIFFKRTTAWASFSAMVISVIVSLTLDYTTNFNFAFIGTIQFMIVMILAVLFSLLEKPKSEQELENLTIWTIPDVKGPWIGLASWPGLKRWAIGLPLGWAVLTAVWELYVMK